MCFVKGLANYIKYLHMFLTLNHICPNNLPIWKFVTKPQQTNEQMREVINHSTHTHLLNTIKSILKTLQEESLWQEDFDNLYF